MIDRPELAELLTIAAAADTRFPALTGTQDPRLAAWATILGDVRLEDAQEAVMRIVRRPQMQVMQPGHVLDEIRVLRRERVKALGDDDLTPPDDLLPGQWPAWLRAARRAVGDGLTAQEAMDVADVELGITHRRMLGPSTGRPLSLEGVVKRA